MSTNASDWDGEKLKDIYMMSVGRLLFDVQNFDADAGYEMLKALGHPVTPAHVQVMPHIDIKGIRLTELAQRAHLTKQSTWELIRNMETHGYIERMTDPHDGRAIRISYTKKGVEFFRDVCLGLLIREEDLAARIGKGNAKTLKDLLTELRASYAEDPPAMAALTERLRARREKVRGTTPKKAPRRTG